MLYHIVPLFGDKSEAPAPLTTTNDPLKSLLRRVFACCFSGGLLGWDVFLNSLLRVGLTRGFFFVVFVVTLLFLLLRCWCWCYVVGIGVTLLFWCYVVVLVLLCCFCCYYVVLLLLRRSVVTTLLC